MDPKGHHRKDIGKDDHQDAHVARILSTISE
jgi:hypothetical protein